MSDSNPTPPRPPRGIIGEVKRTTDPAEKERSLERNRQFNKTALSKIGPDIAEAPPWLLAQYIIEMEADERQQFLDELLQRLPEDVLVGLGEGLQKRLGRGAA